MLTVSHVICIATPGWIPSHLPILKGDLPDKWDAEVVDPVHQGSEHQHVAREHFIRNLQ